MKSSICNIDNLITSDHIKLLNENGVILIKKIIDEESIRLLQIMTNDRLSQQENNEGYYSMFGRKRDNTSVNDMHMWLEDKSYKDFLFESDIAKYIAELLDSTYIRLFYDNLRVKFCGSDTNHTPWHQDTSYTSIIGKKQCRTWIALDEVTADSGALLFLPKTHTEKYKYVNDDTFYNPNLRDALKKEGYEPISNIDFSKQDIMMFEVSPGDCLIFHPGILHGAMPNKSKNIRSALSIYWIGDDICYQPKIWHMQLGFRQKPKTEIGKLIKEDQFPLVWGIEELHDQ